jgi:hypothetical protein
MRSHRRNRTTSCHMRLAQAALFICAVSASAAAQERSSAPRVQDRQFLFSVSTLPSDTRHATVHLESGFGDRAFDVIEGDRPEQRFGIQAFVGRRFTLLARLGVSSDDRDVRSSQQAKMLYSIVEGRRTQVRSGWACDTSRRTPTSCLVDLSRAARSMPGGWTGTSCSRSRFERPRRYRPDTSIGVARRILPALYAGLELIGEDLEGFWEPEEAEGGARLMLGPSMRIAPPSKRWQLSAAGGPIVRATRSDLSSGAARSLPDSGNGYAVRIAFGYIF